MKMLAIYDIAHPKRLVKVAKIMKDYGVRVQQSKFEIDPSPAAFQVLKARIFETIDMEKDGVKYIPICRKCEGKTEIIGLGSYIDPDEEYYIL
ncbi:MAG: CRISPR-associated endonuclease Cas2 [Thermodesulfobacteriota bacterium]|nr:CRISPR-associated endonuclease Cas2 [Thermodesulfobacteriota bacterium]